MAVTVGTKIADFNLKDQFGEDISSAAFSGKSLLLSFHPLAWTGICAQQMQKLDSLYDKFEKLGVVPLGVSIDTSYSKKAWGESLGLKKLKLLADFWPHGALAESLGIFRADGGFSERANVIIKDGVVEWIQVYEIATLPDFEDVFEFLK